MPLSRDSAAKGRSSKSPAPLALIFSPHPDDECIVGGLPLRLQREAGFHVINIAVTLGSKAARRKARLKELTAACDYLGFSLQQIVPGGLEKVTPVARVHEPKRWETMVRATAALLWRHQPAVIFVPHVHDWHPAHIGTHWLVLDALATLPGDFCCTLVETEFWGQLQSPNLLVESGAADVADLVAGLACHVGEVKRNPYHLRLPAWMMDNVRRGAELVGQAGAKAPEFVFGTLYRMRRWPAGPDKVLFPKGKIVGKETTVWRSLKLPT